MHLLCASGLRVVVRARGTSGWTLKWSETNYPDGVEGRASSHAIPRVVGGPSP